MRTAVPRPVAHVPSTSAGFDLRTALQELQQGDDGADSPVVEVVERAVATAWSRLLPDAPHVVARLDRASGRLELTCPEQDGRPVTREELPPDFARHAAHAAKSAIAAWRRDIERERVVREAVARRGELVDAIVERADGLQWSLRVGQSPAVLPPEEQLPGEQLDRGQHLKVIVLDARRRGREAVMVVSRSHPNLLRRLLEQEVPELGSGQVAVRAVARDPGRRSKVAVEAPTGSVDPEGACIGPRGVRIRAVVAELGEEQVHIVAWSSDPATLVARALGPAEVVDVQLDQETRTARVTVPASQLSLAIGRAGENARLAARLTGWRIDIHGSGEDGEAGSRADEPTREPEP